MRVRLTIDKRMYWLLEEEAEKYSIPVNRLINQIISSSEELEPRFYKIEKDNKVKDVKVNAENRDIWNKQLRVHGEYSKSELVRAYIAAYLFLPLFIREQIIYKNIIEEIQTAIDNNESIEISHTKNGIEYEKRIIDPYKIVTTQTEENNYLIAFCHKRQDIRTFRISRISKIKNLHEKFKVKDEYKYILNKSKEYFDGFLSYGKFVKVELTERGIGMLNIVTLNRPLEISKKSIYENPDKYQDVSISEEELENDRIKVFECSPYQCEAYFFQYLENVLILEPVSVRDKMYDRLKKGLEKIEVCK